jgi:hypothetical protein
MSFHQKNIRHMPRSSWSYPRSGASRLALGDKLLKQRSQLQRRTRRSIGQDRDLPRSLDVRLPRELASARDLVSRQAAASSTAFWVDKKARAAKRNHAGKSPRRKRSR